MLIPLVLLNTIRKATPYCNYIGQFHGYMYKTSLHVYNNFSLLSIKIFFTCFFSKVMLFVWNVIYGLLTINWQLCAREEGNVRDVVRPELSDC